MATAAANERVRNAARSLHQGLQNLQEEMSRHAVLFKLVAEDMERENDSESVAKLREGLLGVIESGHRLDMQRSAVLNVSQHYEARNELTEFRAFLEKSTQELLDASPLDPATHVNFQQFDKAIWNIHHAGEPAPGQEQEEFVMITSGNGILNHNCPISGKSVASLEDPVRSIECHHIYDRSSVVNYIQGKAARGQPCNCGVAGCTKNLTLVNLLCDAALKMEIQEHRLREMATQAADYTEVDVEDEDNPDDLLLGMDIKPLRAAI